MKSLKQYINEASGKYCVNYVHAAGNDSACCDSLNACYGILKKASGLKYYDITTGGNTSETSGLVEWAGKGGFWANRLESTAKSTRGKREHDTIAKKQSDISKFK